MPSSCFSNGGGSSSTNLHVASSMPSASFLGDAPASEKADASVYGSMPRCRLSSFADTASSTALSSARVRSNKFSSISASRLASRWCRRTRSRCSMSEWIRRQEPRSRRRFSESSSKPRLPRSWTSSIWKSSTGLELADTSISLNSCRIPGDCIISSNSLQLMVADSSRSQATKISASFERNLARSSLKASSWLGCSSPVSEMFRSFSQTTPVTRFMRARLDTQMKIMK
mmetsp:Transcript_82025/g.240800  ORF Transcript_82025/g.240800 Transcript_82025/m.240800 type:complete len:229 (+) Transcript_82025:374-1060(+)